MAEHNSCHLANGFTTGEKIFAQVTYNAFWITGVIAIWQDSIFWALAYAVIVAYGIMGLVARHLICPRCPHLYQYDDCLQVPPGLVKKIVKRVKTTPLSKGEKALVMVVMLVNPLFPQYWLWDKPVYLAVFWVFCGAWYAAQVFHFCKHCRVSSCPMNRSGVCA